MYLQTTDILAVMIALVASVLLLFAVMIRQIKIERSLAYWRQSAIDLMSIHLDTCDSCNTKMSVNDVVKQIEEDKANA
jgi:hypothetical protein